MEVSFWRRLWTCRQTEYWVNEWMFPVNTITRHYITFYKSGIFISTFVRNSILTNIYTLSFHGTTAPSGPEPPHYRGFTISLIHMTIGSISLDEWSVRCIDVYRTTHNTHMRQNFRPPTADPRLWLRGHWDWQLYEGWNFNSGNYLFTTDTK